MLACNRVYGRHTADNIVLSFEEAISNFSASEKVKHIVTDSGANIKKPFVTLPGYNEDDGDHDDEDEESKLGNENDDFEHASLSLESLSFEHHACFAHMLQLVIKDGMNKVGPINSVLKRCSKLVSFVHKSTTATDVLDGQAIRRFTVTSRQQ